MTKIEIKIETEESGRGLVIVKKGLNLVVVKENQGLEVGIGKTGEEANLGLFFIYNFFCHILKVL